MLSAEQIQIVKSTVPLLESAGVAITEHFYKRMFKANPELMNIFNMSNQVNGKQQFALFSAVASYAKHIDNLGALGAMVERVAHKHASFMIEPAHYDIVGHHLIGTLKELAPQEFTEPVAEAWTQAYNMLAGILIGREQHLYQDKSQAKGGWRGARRFVVSEKTAESELVSSFVLTPEDGGAVVDYQPGQYLGIKVKPDHADYVEIRQYSLSDQANGRSYRISVKREELPQAGVVSNYLHDQIQVGDSIEVMPPGGDFYLKSLTQPTVLISAGVGQTPMMAMLETLASKQSSTPIWYLHACENPAQHSFDQRIQELKENHSTLHNHTWYNQPQLNHPFNGLMQLADIADELPLQTGQFYLCGPTGFMKFAKDQLLAMDVKPESIHYEVFGPHSDF
ncbi:flavohemoprotein [Cellvibrio zantedeschiae]|uniref:Flavohemoprotein n=1 Tax=Cellvibrio zantedeschiae TaxID=1237077 RepID=A0ABQ3B9F4_9GAMM|nr:NO-inducible flavohemoprotein [Cellvibrio zantedeschiae]GGY84560.1 flavohemoprotein [Cellvibrio zantedeschiae]